MSSAEDERSPREGEQADEGGLPESDEIYRLIVESVRDYAIFALDATGHVVTWNPGAAALKGYRANEILGRHFSAFYPDEDVARGKPAHELSVASEYGRFEDEGWRIRADGSRFWANVIITAMRSKEDGTLLGFSKVTRDLTERRQGEEALRRSEERFRLLVEGVTDYAIILLDTKGRVQSWNRGAERLLGYRAGEIVGDHIRRFYPHDDVVAGRPQVELDTASSTGRYEEEGWRIRRDGTRFWANVIVTALRDPRDGRLLGFSKVTRDLTERRRNEEALRRAYRDLEAFSYTVSHDLRAPLRAIHQRADVLSGSIPAELRTHVDAIRASAKDGEELTENLLRFSRVSAGELQDLPVDLAELAREIGLRLAVTTPHAVKLIVADDARMQVRGDPALLRLVLENLLSNAYKFTKAAKDARIEFYVETHDDRAAPVFVVRDNGAGFDPTRAKGLFEPFKRLHPQAEFPGTGIGLATVRRILVRHGGEIWADAKPGGGASFSFTLPGR